MHLLFVCCAYPRLRPSLWVETTRRPQGVEHRPGNVQFVWVVSSQMEAAMYRNLAVIAGALTILSGALFVSDSAQAGASASAPSKNQHANQLVMQQGQTKQAGR